MTSSGSVPCSLSPKSVRNMVSHLLPGYEVLLGLHRVLALVHPTMPAWSLNSARADCVHADLPPNKIGRQTFCETNHCGLGRPVSKPIWRPLDRGGDRGHVDDVASIRHQRGNGLTDPEHASHIDVEAALEDLISAVKDAPLANIPGTIEEDVHLRQVLGQIQNIFLFCDIEGSHSNGQVLLSSLRYKAF